MNGIKRPSDNALIPEAKKLRWLQWRQSVSKSDSSTPPLSAHRGELPQVMTSTSVTSVDYPIDAVIEEMDLSPADAEDFLAFLKREEEEADKDLYERHLDDSVVCPVCKIGGLSIESRTGGFFLGCTKCETNVPLIDPTLTMEEVKDGLAEVISSHARGKCTAFPTFEVQESVLFLRCNPCGYCEVAI